MQISERWLREWVTLPEGMTAASLAHRYTMAGLEAAAAPAHAGGLGQVVVAEILATEKHPEADRLKVCTVDAGEGAPRQIVCGAANARPGLKVPCALPGAVLPNGVEIHAAKLRGVESAGMLCSASELALADKSDGLLELDATAPVGLNLGDYLHLPGDSLLSFELTPNRGDALSVRGLAREAAAMLGTDGYAEPATPTVAATLDATFPVTVESATDCPVYCGRVIEGVDARARTPDWLREKLRRSGVRSISVLVDITNLVLLELGQPLHAFDLERLAQGLAVRRARDGETLVALSGEDLRLDARDLVIADGQGPVALAGVMGGRPTGVTDGTTQVFIESAHFAAAALAGTARRHKLHTDASHRFERGTDPELPRSALERATALVLALCGGEAGPVTTVGQAPRRAPVHLRAHRVPALLGVGLDGPVVTSLLERLGAQVRATEDGWLVAAPAWRADLAIEEDLIEELARLHGYERLAAPARPAYLDPRPRPEGVAPASRLRLALAARGWQEIVSYSFTDPALDTLLNPAAGHQRLKLDNPIAETLGVMRTRLLPGLIQAWLYNHQRQQPRVRLFELGATYARTDEPGAGDADGAGAGIAIRESRRLAGLAAGPSAPEQWGTIGPERQRRVDFHDLRGTVEALLGPAKDRAVWTPETADPAFHPGRTARVTLDGEPLGVVGELHPALVAGAGWPGPAVAFELDVEALARANPVPMARTPSEFPATRRDLALEAADRVPSAELVRTARGAGGEFLRQLVVFDEYRGGSLEPGHRSVALGLIFQADSRTLEAVEIDAVMSRVTEALATGCAARVRAS